MKVDTLEKGLKRSSELCPVHHKIDSMLGIGLHVIWSRELRQLWLPLSWDRADGNFIILLQSLIHQQNIILGDNKQISDFGTSNMVPRVHVI